MVNALWYKVLFYLPPMPRCYDLLAWNPCSRFTFFTSPQACLHFVFSTVIDPVPSVLIFVSLITVLPPSEERVLGDELDTAGECATFCAGGGGDRSPWLTSDRVGLEPNSGLGGPNG